MYGVVSGQTSRDGRQLKQLFRHVSTPYRELLAVVSHPLGVDKTFRLNDHVYPLCCVLSQAPRQGINMLQTMLQHMNVMHVQYIMLCSVRSV